MQIMDWSATVVAAVSDRPTRLWSSLEIRYTSGMIDRCFHCLWFGITLFAFRQRVRSCTLHYLSVYLDRCASVFHVFDAVNVDSVCQI